MKKLIYCIVLSVFTLNIGLAADLSKLMEEGNNFYSKNEFEKSITAYQKIINQGYTSAALYFNLGNAYFKTKNTSKAILYYEKARLLAPSDKDIIYNLELARSYTVDKIESIPEVFLLTWFHSIRNLFSLQTWTFLSIFLFILTLAFFLWYLLTSKVVFKKIGFYAGSIFLVFTIWSFISAYSHYTAITKQNTAIVFTPTVNIKSSPSETGNNLFILHEGTKVEIIDKIGDWCEIKIASGSRGFIKKTDLEVI